MIPLLGMRLTLALLSCLGLLPFIGHAAPILENVAGTIIGSNIYYGQSFTLPTGGPWNNITFNLFSDVPAATPFAVGTAFLFTSLYTGTPSGLSSAAPGFLASSTGISGGQYVFSPGLTLFPSTQYFLFVNTLISGASGADVFAGGNAYATLSSTSSFGATGSASVNFEVSGAAATPEPNSGALLASSLVGLVLIGGRRFVRN